MGSGPLTGGLIAELQTEFPRLRLLNKTASRWSRCLDVLVRIATLGRQRAYMTRYVTTIGRTIYLPDGFDRRSDADSYVTLRHEAVHLRQFRRYGLVGTSLIYLLPILPLGLALGRALLEREAYAETLRATAAVRGVGAAADPALRAHIIAQFVTGAYGWMWPFPRVVAGWIDGVLAELEGGGMGHDGAGDPRQDGAGPVDSAT